MQFHFIRLTSLVKSTDIFRSNYFSKGQTEKNSSFHFLFLSPIPHISENLLKISRATNWFVKWNGLLDRLVRLVKVDLPSKVVPFLLEIFRSDRTVPFDFRPKFPAFLAWWKTPDVSLIYIDKIFRYLASYESIVVRMQKCFCRHLLRSVTDSRQTWLKNSKQ